MTTTLARATATAQTQARNPGMPLDLGWCAPPA